MNEKAKKSYEHLVKFANQLGYWPVRSEWDAYAKEHDLYSVSALMYHTQRNWEEMRKEAGFPAKSKQFSQEECVEAIKIASKELGYFFNRKQYETWQKKNPKYPTSAQISRRCKGFNIAKEMAGLIPNRPMTEPFTDEELIQALQACSNDLGSLFSETQYMEWRAGREEIPHVETIRQRLGGLVEAKRKLGLESYQKGPNTRYDESRWKEPFMRFLEDILSHSTYEQWLEKNDGPSLGALWDHAGGYEQALLNMLPEYIKKIDEKRKKRRE